MTKVLVTGAKGFIGKNVSIALSRMEGVELVAYDLDSPESVLRDALESCDAVFHLAGVNRPKDAAEFESGNHGFTKALLDGLKGRERPPRIAVTSSVQAALDNDYGKSKLAAEREVFAYAEETGASVFVYRLANVFGKWCRPYYNSVVATFCHQAARGEPLSVNDPARSVEFVYVGDVVAELLSCLGEGKDAAPGTVRGVAPSFSATIGELARTIESFRGIRRGGLLPDLGDPFEKRLYSTYLSYLEPAEFGYRADKKSDNRGYLFELVKTRGAGQIFVSRTSPGIVRGNHYHDSKVEKFCVVEGKGRISFRHMASGAAHSVDVDGEDCEVVDIPPGYTHSIKNIGEGDMITIFWANEVFDQSNPDTYYSEV